MSEYELPHHWQEEADRRREDAAWDDHVRAKEEREFDYGKRSYAPDPKPAKRVSRRTAPKPDERWRELIFQRDQGCLYHDDPALCSGDPEAHHVVLQQTLRRDFPEALWRPESGICLCAWAHRSFHAGGVILTLERLPLEVVGYLRSVGFGWYLDKHYPSRRAAA